MCFPLVFLLSEEPPKKVRCSLFTRTSTTLSSVFTHVPFALLFGAHLHAYIFDVFEAFRMVLEG